MISVLINVETLAIASSPNKIVSPACNQKCEVEYVTKPLICYFGCY